MSFNHPVPFDPARVARLERRVNRARGALASAVAADNRIRARYDAHPMESNWKRACMSIRVRDRAVAALVAAERDLDAARVRPAPVAAGTVDVARVPAESGRLVAFVAGIVAAVVPAVAFLSSVIPAEVFAAVLR